MYRLFPVLIFSFFSFSCGTTTTYNSDYDLLMTAYPDQSKFGNYSSYESEIVGYSIETKTYVRFTDDNFEDDSPSCSPSRDKILFASRRPITGYFSREAPSNLFILDIPTKEIKQITSVTLNDINKENFIHFSNPVWCPVSDEIAFGMTYFDSSKLVIYDLDTEEIKLAINVPDIYKIHWSSDGQFVGYQGIHTHTDRVGNELSMTLTFESGFIDIENQEKIILEKADRLNWGLISGINENNNFMIYNIDSANAPMQIYEYDVITNDKKYLTTTLERLPAVCGSTADEILFIKTAENNSEDIWSLNIKTNSFKQITFDGKSKTDLKYFSK